MFSPDEPYYPYANVSDGTHKCLLQVPLSKPPTPRVMNPSVTMRAPWANSENDKGLAYTWKPPTITERRVTNPPPQVSLREGPAAAGVGPDLRRPRGRAVGLGHERRILTGQYPFDRDEILTLDRKEYFTSKHWDNQCGTIPKLPVPTKSQYQYQLENSASRQKCNIRCEAQSYKPIPAGLERIYPRDVSDWPEKNPKPLVRLNTAFNNHETTRSSRQAMPLPKFGDTDTMYGGAMGTCKPRPYGATIDKLSRGELQSAQQFMTQNTWKI